MVVHLVATPFVVKNSRTSQVMKDAPWSECAHVGVPMSEKSEVRYFIAMVAHQQDKGRQKETWSTHPLTLTEVDADVPIDNCTR